MDHSTRVSIQLLNVNAHKITMIIQKLRETHRLMNKPGLAFVSTTDTQSSGLWSGSCSTVT
jgi:hypothetical protein